MVNVVSSNSKAPVHFDSRHRREREPRVLTLILHNFRSVIPYPNVKYDRDKGLRGQSRPLFGLFLVFFKQTKQFLHQINVKKCPSSIQCRDSNSQPSDYESSPLPLDQASRPSSDSLSKFL